MAKKKSTPKKLTDKKTQEARKQFKRIRDALSRIRRQMKKKGFETYGITIKDIREQPPAVLSEITPEYLRSRTFINVGGLDIDINEYLESPVFYEDLFANKADYEDAPYNKPYEDIIAQVNDYIWEHEDNPYLSSAKNDKLRLTLANMLNDAISNNGFEITADRIMNTDWKNSLDPPFTDSKEERVFTSDLMYFAMVLKDAPLTPQEAMHISDYSLTNEQISKPHGSDL